MILHTDMCIAILMYYSYFFICFHVRGVSLCHTVHTALQFNTVIALYISYLSSSFVYVASSSVQFGNSLLKNILAQNTHALFL